MEVKIIRKMDKLGRIVIPNDIRKTLNLTREDEIEITIENGAVVMKKSKKTKM